MNEKDSNLSTQVVIETDVLQPLLTQQPPVVLDPALRLRMRGNILSMIAQEPVGSQAGFKTVRANEGEWLEPVPGAQIKILNEESPGVLTYLARLAPGFEMPGHPHPVNEECIMLEGDLWMGELYLQAGDYHFAAKGLHHGTLRTEKGALVFLKGALPA